MGKRSSIVAILGEFLAHYPRQFSLLFLLLLVEGAAAAMSILAIVPLADFLLDPSLEKPSRLTQAVIGACAAMGWPVTFWMLGALFVASTFLKSTLEVAIRHAIFRIKYAVLRGMFGDALRTFFRARWEFFSGADHGRLLNTLSKELDIIGGALGDSALLLAQVVQLCIYLAVPFWLNATMTLTALGLAFLIAVPFMLAQRVSYRLGIRNTETGNAATGVLSEVLQAARLILGFGRQDQARDRYLKAFDDHIRVTLLSQTLRIAVPKFFQPLTLLAAVVAMGFALERQARIFELAAVMWSLLASMPILTALLQGNISVSNFLPSYEQLVSLRKRAAEFAEVEGPRIFGILERGIELRDVDFTYPGRQQTLTKVSLDIRKGKMTALVGESGSGKSTVTDLVLGLQIPEQGQVSIDGVPLGEWKQNSFRERVGYGRRIRCCSTLPSATIFCGHSKVPVKPTSGRRFASPTPKSSYGSCPMGSIPWLVTGA